MRILVTGVTGFVGRHLVALGGDEYVGVARAAPVDSFALAVPVHTLDLNDTDRLTDLLRDSEPKAIIHLAGYSDAGGSFREPERAWSGNLSATLSLYRAVERWGGRPRVLFVSSGMVYGEAMVGRPVCDETTPLLPDSPYSASKAAADLASYQAFCHPGLPIIRVRPFNQIGPGQSPRFSVASFAQRIARIEAGELPPILETDNLDAGRDLTDVRDMVTAYRALLTSGVPGEVYNAARGQTVPMSEVVTRLLAMACCRIELRVRTEVRRPRDITPPPVVTAKLRKATGWSPRMSMEKSLRDVLDEARYRLRAGPPTPTHLPRPS